MGAVFDVMGVVSEMSASSSLVKTCVTASG
jgi:hypothetical protein